MLAGWTVLIRVQLTPFHEKRPLTAKSPYNVEPEAVMIVGWPVLIWVQALPFHE